MLSKSIKIYISLIIILAVLSGISVFLFSPQLLPTEQLPASKPIMAMVNVLIMLVIYGGLGYLGYRLSRKLGFSDIWDSAVTNKQRFLLPAIFGFGIGLFFIFIDSLFSKLHPLGNLPHPEFPLSLIASITAGIGEEIMFRLFLIPFWVWLISFVLLKKRWLNQVFWIVAIFSALAFSAGHIPSVMAILGISNANLIPIPLLGEIFILNGALSLVVAYFFRKYGLLAAIGIHFWTDIVWHVLWPLLS